jgi:SynChlorMet cassette protein ScmC
LGLTFGPLHYQLLAHDAWGEETLGRLQRTLDCTAFAGAPDRVVHLLVFRVTPQDRQQQGINSVYLPDRLAQVLPGSPPRLGWKHVTDTTGRKAWYHPEMIHSIWTYDAGWDDGQVPMQLPWQLILEDIVQRGGGIFHGGLAILENRGYLFTAPPGGGKTTALLRMPSPWKTLSDDAALVWPAGNGAFRASPLPTWSVLLGRDEGAPGIDRWKVDTSFEIVKVILLKKARQDRLFPLPPFEAAQLLYRAFSEHPRVVSNRDPFRKRLFHAACDLARAVPSWELELTRAGDFWSLLQDDLPASR